MDEHAFIARVEAANADEFRELMAHPTAEEERILRIHLGPTRFQHMHSLALTRSRSARGAPKGNVVVLPGIMGSELTSYSRSGDGDHLWLDLVRIVNGRLDRLRLSDDGRSGYNDGYDVRATGILKRYYGELMLSLSEQWTVRAFWFDWRKDLNVAASELSAQMSNWFDHEAPVHIVAHSLGGLVARTFIGNFPDQWDRMKDPGDPAMGRAELTLGGRLVMMGTPNHGSFSIPQAIIGLEETVSKLALVDLRHNKEEILEILNSFVATYQMLPSPLAVPEAEPLYDESSYGSLDILPQRLTTARRHHERLRDVVQPDRMIYIAGSNRPTFSSIVNYDKLHVMEGYQVTLDGDGRVPHALGDLRSKDGGIVPMYFIDEDHGGLSSNRDLLDALDELLRTGTTRRLSQSLDDLPKSRSRARGAAEVMDPRSQRQAEIAEDREQLRTLLGQSRSWRSAVDGRSRRSSSEPDEADVADGDTDLVTDTFVSIHEREIEELITRGVIGSREPGARRVAVEVPFEATSIELRLIDDAIENVGVKGVGEADSTPVDVIAVGHYLGVRPEGAELALDQAISLISAKAKRKTRSIASDADLLLTQFAERGTIRGDLGQAFFLPDPRVHGSTVDRTIAVVGMGVSGRFGVPELTVVARELCWAVGRMGKRHLATVMIGSGLGNLSVRDATLAWMRGIKQAITGMEESDPHRLLRVSFAIRSPDSFQEAHDAIVDEQRRLKEAERLIFDFEPLRKDELQTVTQRLGKKRQAAAKMERGTNRAEQELPPSRLTVTMDRNAYLFGAITGGASIPERRIPIDPLLIKDANDELSAAWDPAMQYERGRFLEQLLLPDDLRGQIYSPAPLVLMLDSTTARIHWEMIALSEPELIRRRDDDGHDYGFDERRFLGTSRALTRQLRTTFAPPPDPTPPPRRVMRVLVVADPAEDASLPGAEEEGVAVADLFEQFNTVYKDGDNRVEVVRMFGPQEATRTNVLRELTNRSYDVLHYAGHCVYDEKDPAASGWVFSKGQRISASELARIDRVPNFVFSNACESGITPDRREKRSVELAPSFAEAFFARGVSNFVCTAWPVDDLASERFARTLYANLLGLEEVPGDEGRRSYTPIRPRRMHEAMLEARLQTAAETNGAQSWGAYQHYGNPYLYFFDTSSVNGSGDETNGNEKA